jgi:hypothetical protein
MTVARADALSLKNGAESTETPSATSGKVVSGPRLSVREERSWTVILKPEPDLRVCAGD